MARAARVVWEERAATGVGAVVRQEAVRKSRAAAGLGVAVVDLDRVTYGVRRCRTVQTLRIIQGPSGQPAEFSSSTAPPARTL